MSTLHDLPPVVIEAFYSKAPLNSVLGCFPSKKELLESYAKLQAEVFSASASNSKPCDVCNAATPEQRIIAVRWEGIIRWRRKSVITFLLLSPVLMPFALNHLTKILLAYVLKDVQFWETAGFTTFHPLCQRCVMRLRLRLFFHGCLTFLGGFIGVVSGGASIILGAVIVAMLLSTFGFHPRDSIELLPWFFAAVTISLVTVASARIFGKAVLLPSSIASTVKRPFRHMGWQWVPTTLERQL